MMLRIFIAFPVYAELYSGLDNFDFGTLLGKGSWSH